MLRKTEYLEKIKIKSSEAFLAGFEDGYDIGLEPALNQNLKNPFFELKQLEHHGATSSFLAFFNYFISVFNVFQDEKLELFEYDLDIIIKIYQQIFKIIPQLEDLKNTALSEKEKIEAAEIILKNNIRYYVSNDAEKKELQALKKNWLNVIKDFVNGYEDGFKFGILNGIIIQREEKELSGEVFLKENLVPVMEVDYAFWEGYSDAMKLSEKTSDFSTGSEFLFNFLKNILEEEYNKFFVNNSVENESVEVLKERYAIYTDLIEYLLTEQLSFDEFYPEQFSELFFGFFGELYISDENQIFFSNLLETKYLPALISYSEGFESAVRNDLSLKENAEDNLINSSENPVNLLAGSRNKMSDKELPEFLKDTDEEFYKALETLFSDDFLIYDNETVPLDLKDEVNLDKMLKTVFSEVITNDRNSFDGLILPLASLRTLDENKTHEYENRNVSRDNYLKKVVGLISPDKVFSRFKKFFSSKNETFQNPENSISDQNTELTTQTRIKIPAAFFLEISQGLGFNHGNDEAKLEDKVLDNHEMCDFSKLASGLVSDSNNDLVSFPAKLKV